MNFQNVQEDNGSPNRISINQNKRQNGPIPLIIRPDSTSNIQSPIQPNEKKKKYYQNSDQVIDLQGKNEQQIHKNRNQNNYDDDDDDDGNDAISFKSEIIKSTQAIQKQIPLIEPIFSPQIPTQLQYFNKPLQSEVIAANQSSNNPPLNQQQITQQLPSRISKQLIKTEVQESRIEQDNLINTQFQNEIIPTTNKEVYENHIIISKNEFKDESKLLIDSNNCMNCTSFETNNIHTLEENKENIDNQNGQVYQRNNKSNQVYYYEKKQNNIFQNIFQPRQQIDGILLQNDLNYFDDEEQQERKSNKNTQINNPIIFSSQQQGVDKDKEIQYYNPVILPNSIKSVRSKSLKQKESRGNSSTQNPDKVVYQPILSSNSLKYKNDPNKKEQSSHKFLKVESLQQLDVDYIESSSSDSSDKQISQNKFPFQKIKQIHRNDPQQYQTLKQKSIEIQKNQDYKQNNFKVNNKLPQVNSPSLLPPINPQKIQSYQTKIQQNYYDTPITQDPIRKSRSNSFTDQKNIFQKNNNNNVNQSIQFSNLNQKYIKSNQNVQQKNNNQQILSKNEVIQQTFNNQNQIRNQQQSFHLNKQFIPLIVQQTDSGFINERDQRINTIINDQTSNEVSQTIDFVHEQNNIQNNTRPSQQRQTSRHRQRQVSQTSPNQTSQQQNQQNQYNDIRQTRDQINAQQSNLNEQFQDRQNRINQIPPPRFMIDNMYDQFLEFQNQLRQHKGQKVDKIVSTTIFHKQQAQHLPQDAKQCSICLCEFEDQEKISFLACFHRFHTECIFKWFESKATCPLCKKDQKALMKDLNHLLDEF